MHWTLEVADQVGQLCKALRKQQVPERHIDAAVRLYLASIAAEHGVTPEVATAALAETATV